MNPLWIPLLTMLSALGKDTDERPPRPVTGDPLNKTIYDHADKIFGPVMAEARAFLAGVPDARVEDLIIYLSRRMGSDPKDPSFTALFSLFYNISKAEPDKTIWQLDSDAYEALINTALPWELARERLPRLPYEGLLVQLPKGVRMPVQTPQSMPSKVNISSLLVVEEVPGRKWRYIGIADDTDLAKVAYTRGWFDLSLASAKAQLLEGRSVPTEVKEGPYTTIASSYPGQILKYEITGEDKVWQFLLNLFLALEHKHLDGQRVRPKVPRGRQARHFTKRYSPSEYTVVRLSQASRETQRKQKAVSDATRRSMKRHLVSGHWRSVWVVDPEGKPIFGTKPRVGRDGRTLEGHLFKTAVWIFPFWKGDEDGSDATKKYKVKL